MNPILFLIEIFKKTPDQTVLVWRDQKYSYAWLIERIASWSLQLDERGIQPGAVVSISGDFTPNSIALLLALTARRAITVPLLISQSDEIRMRNREIAEVEFAFELDLATDDFAYSQTGVQASHDLIVNLRRNDVPGLILFSSGSSGKPKAAVHNFSKLLRKFETSRPSLRILNFLLFDHWGGLNTLLHTVSTSGTVFTVPDRRPETICENIQKHQIEVLPVSPSFLNLLLLSKAYESFDLSSLKIISYGTEPMPPTTLERVRTLFPNVKLNQTYGLIELGVLRAKSKSDDSLWVKIGGDGYDVRVCDGLLEIKSESAMLGYLNAPSPFTEDGWFKTGDSVEVDGDYFRILGRKSELINVGGEKVYPQEIENVIQRVENVSEVTVYAEKHPILGNIVCAKVGLIEPEDEKVVASRVRKKCTELLARFKVPVKILVVTATLHNDRFKKARGSVNG